MIEIGTATVLAPLEVGQVVHVFAETGSGVLELRVSEHSDPECPRNGGDPLGTA